jgi:hypothetical protein
MPSIADQFADALAAQLSECSLRCEHVVIPGDIALQQAVDAPPPRRGGRLPPQPVTVPAAAELDRLALLQNGDGHVTIPCGCGCAGAQDELVALAEVAGICGIRIEDPEPALPAAYAGFMYQTADGGLSSGFLHHDAIDPGVGLRFPF